jgi:hypothetical protein
VESLLKDPDIPSRWDPEDFWGVVATGVVFIAESDNDSDTATRVVQRLRTARLVLVVFPIAKRNLGRASVRIFVWRGRLARQQSGCVRQFGISWPPQYGTSRCWLIGGAVSGRWDRGAGGPLARAEGPSVADRR